MNQTLRLASLVALLTSSLLMFAACGDDSSGDDAGNNAANNSANSGQNNSTANNANNTNNSTSNNTNNTNNSTANNSNNANNANNSTTNNTNNSTANNSASAVEECEGLCDTIAACDGIAVDCPAEVGEAFLTGCKGRCGDPAFQAEIGAADGAPCEVVVPIALESAQLLDECGGEVPESCDEIGAEACFTNDDCADQATRCQNVGIDLPCCVPGERGTGAPGDACDSENDCASALCIEGYCAPSTCETNTDCPTPLPCCIAIGGVGNLCLPESDSTCQL